MRGFFLGGILLLSLTAVQQTDPIEVLIRRTTDAELIAKLVDFKRDGYEYPLKGGVYDTEKIILSAETFLGVPHKMGGTSASGLDCSGLVMLACNQNYLDMPHSSHEQARYGKIILFQEQLVRGDLLFFYGTYKTNLLVSHSGIYLGEGKFLHVSSMSGTKISDVTSAYWKSHFLFGTRHTPN